MNKKTIFFRRKYKAPTQRVEVFIPSEDYDYIGLYALSNNIAKRALLNKIVADWCKVMIADYPEERVIADIVFIAEKQWASNKSKFDSFNAFLDQLEVELERANIIPSARVRIIEKLDEATKDRPERAFE